MSSLSASAQSHLDELVDWNADLNNIAHPMLDWEERLCTHLGLTVEDVHDIKVKHQNNPALQRSVCECDSRKLIGDCVLLVAVAMQDF